MPHIGRIDIPDELWQELVRCHAQKVASEIFEQIENIYLLIDTENQRNQLETNLDAKLQVLNDRLNVLIRSQTGSSDTFEDFGKVWSAVAHFTDQVTFDALFSVSHLKSAIDLRLQESNGKSLISP